MNGRGRLMLIVLGAQLMLAACSKEAVLNRFASPEEQSTARLYIDRLRSRDFSEIEKAADPAIAGPSLDDTLSKMADLMPGAPPDAVTLVGAQQFSSANGRFVNLTYEYQFGQRYVLANVATKVKDGHLSIVGFHINPEAESLASRNRFTLAGKSLLQYAVLSYAILVAVFTVAVVVLAARTKMARRKWLWIVFILFGFGKLWVNWTTGEAGIMPLAAQLLSASSSAEFYGPWIISISLPIGAVVFLFRRSKLRVAGSQPPS